MSEFIDDKGITKLTWSQYKEKGDHLRKTKGFTAKQIKDLYGKPVIDGVVVEITTGGPNTIRQRSASSRAKSQANRKRKTGIYKNVDTLPKDIKEWANRLTKEGKWPKGKSLQGFIDSHKSAQKKLFNDIEALKNMGFIDDETGRSLIDDGHLIAIGSEQKTGHPLRAKGTHGSHHGEARVPELSAVNQAKREAGDIDFLEAKRGGIITDDLDAFSQYLTDDAGFGPGVKPTTATKQRIAQGAKPEGAMSRQIEATETVRRRRALNPEVSNAITTATKFSKVASGLGTTEAAVMLASGQVIPGTLAIAMQTPAVQKKVAGLLAKQGLKLIPGLSFGSGVIQGAGYALSGQPAKALLSVGGGLIGEIPGIGDAAQAAIDLGLTVHDIKQTKANKPDSDIDMTEGGKVKKHETGIVHSPTGQGDEAFDNVVNRLKDNPNALDTSGFRPRSTFRQLLKSGT